MFSLWKGCLNEESPIVHQEKSTKLTCQVDRTPQSHKRYRELIGSTPMLDLTKLANPKVDGVKIVAKAEFLNPGFSMKDRIAENILRKAIVSGRLAEGGTVVAASSGNTGASIAMLCAMMGLNAIIITSPKCSKEKMDCIRAYGAELIVSKPGQNYMDMEHAMAAEHPDWFAFDQYNNPSNPEAHYQSTGPEIWNQTKQSVTHFVMSGSTGGTISGVGKYLKEQNPNVKIILADPIGSIFAHYYKHREICPPKKFLVEGVGKENIPGAMDFSVIDAVVRVSDGEAFTACRKLAASEGILVGGSAGLNVHAAVELANTVEEPCTIVTILCDLGIKYLSKIYNDDWLAENVKMDAKPGISRSLDFKPILKIQTPTAASGSPSASMSPSKEATTKGAKAVRSASNSKSMPFEKYDADRLTHALTDLSPVIKSIEGSKLLEPVAISDAPVGLFWDLDLYDAHLTSLTRAFGPTFSHRIAMKANPCTRLLQHSFEQHGHGVECASIGEVLHATKHCGIPATHVVFDSPSKGPLELQWALKEKIHVNFDNFIEMNRAKQLIEGQDADLQRMAKSGDLGVCGLRINPLVGSGRIAALSVSTGDSKFAIPVSKREELLRAYADNQWMNCVHVHVGSGGMGAAILTAGIRVAVEFALEVNKLAGYQQIKNLDIGGGLPANHHSDMWGSDKDPNVPTFPEYASILRKEVPELFLGDFAVVTEFGQSVCAKCAFMLSKVEWVKGTEERPMVIIHFGGAECVRQIYVNDDHARRVEAYKADGSRFGGAQNEQLYGRFTKGEGTFSVGGPLCFQGDFVAKNIALPKEVKAGDWIAMKDAGANTLSLFSRHCSRLCPAIYGFRWTSENTVDTQFEVLKPRETPEQLSDFWGQPSNK